MFDSKENYNNIITRRNFLKIAGFTSIASLNSYGQINTNTFNNYPLLDKVVENNVVLPKALKKGSKVAISAPASATSMGEVSKGINALKKLGCSVEISESIKKRDWGHKYLSAPDDFRAEEFMSYIKRKDIDCILTARGGFGSIRILHLLDYELIRQNPKIIIGFSDITSLLCAIYKKTNIVCFHGPVASTDFDSFTFDFFQKVLFEQKKFDPIKYKGLDLKIINQGKACGKLVGGNLTTVTSLLGTEFEIDTDNAILFLEEVSEEPYKIDRMLTQLWLSGKLHRCSGIVFGYIKNLKSRRNFYPGISYSVLEVIESRLKPLGIPSVIGLPFGHSIKTMTLPIGIKAEFDTKSQTFSIIEQSVNYF